MHKLEITDLLEIKRALKAPDLLSVLWNLDQLLRDKAKYSDDPREVQLAEEIREYLHSELDDHAISFGELWE